jgi:hypothetical protein
LLDRASIRRHERPLTTVDNRVPTEKSEGETSTWTTEDPGRAARLRVECAFSVHQPLRVKSYHDTGEYRERTHVHMLYLKIVRENGPPIAAT